MKKSNGLFIIVLCIGLLPLSAYADGPVAIDVPNNCTAIDTSGVSHTFPQNDSPSDYLGICLLETAKEEGLLDFALTNDPSLGLYIKSVNGIEPRATEYWAIWKNGTMAECGIGCIPLAQGDTLSLILTDWTTNIESTTVVLNVHSLVSPPPPPSGRSEGGSGGIPNSTLNVASAIAYLASKQHEDGSFDSLLLSDWVAVAFAAVDPSTPRMKLRNYFFTASSTLLSITDYERHAMALEALGINPYSGTSIDFITPIVRAFDGTQIGDASLDNDDIFALFPLLAAGYGANDVVIQKTTAFILSRQGQNGSWDNSVDLTAAAIQALIPMRVLPDVSLALIRAEGYLRRERPSSSDPGNSFSTSWVRQAISALSWTPSGWTPNAFTEEDYLAELQQSDGGVEPLSFGVQTRVWATAYAIPAALGKSWPMLLQSFMRPNILPLATSTVSTELAPPSTPATSREASSTVFLSQTQTLESKAEVPVVPPVLVPTDKQTAAVANAPVGNAFIYLWNSIATFFKNLL